MDSSVATLKPSLTQSSGPSAAATQYLTVETSTVPYVDPTPATPMGSSAPPSRTPSTRSTADGASPPPHHRHHRARHHVHSLSSDGEASPARSLSDDDRPRGGHGYLSEEDGAGSGASAAGRRGTEPSEIQSIMAQFSGDGGGPGEEEVMSPRLEIASPMLGGPIQHPPRKSSLEPLTAGLGIGTGVGVGVGASSAATSISQGMEKIRLSPGSPAGSTRSVGRHEKKGSVDSEGGDIPPPVPPKDEPSSAGGGREVPLSPTTSREQLHQHRPPPPEPEPEPAQPFDFQRFLEQLRNKKADPVARYLKSFLTEFGKRQWMVHEQVKIISDFLAFIADKMAKCDVWRSVSDAEFDNAREGMEKLVMNRLYSQTFSPAIPPPQPIPGASRRRKDGEQPMGPGRRGQHQEDVERDEILCQKISIYSWVREEHLDIPPVNEHGKRFLKLAQQGWSVLEVHDRGN